MNSTLFIFFLQISLKEISTLLTDSHKYFKTCSLTSWVAIKNLPSHLNLWILKGNCHVFSIKRSCAFFQWTCSRWKRALESRAVSPNVGWCVFQVLTFVWIRELGLLAPGCGLCSGVGPFELLTEWLYSLCTSHPVQPSRCLQGYWLGPQSLSLLGCRQKKARKKARKKKKAPLQFWNIISFPL